MGLGPLVCETVQALLLQPLPSARHTYGAYTMEWSGNAFAIAKSMRHEDLKSMEPYQRQ